MVSESMFCLIRILTCFLAFLFVTSKAAKIRLDCIPLIIVAPNMLMIMFTTTVRAIEMFKVENGMVLIMVEVEALAGVGCDRREKRTKMSEPIMKRTVRVADVAWKYIIRCDFGSSTSISKAKNGAFPGTKEC